MKTFDDRALKASYFHNISCFPTFFYKVSVNKKAEKLGRDPFAKPPVAFFQGLAGEKDEGPFNRLKSFYFLF